MSPNKTRPTPTLSLKLLHLYSLPTQLLTLVHIVDAIMIFLQKEKAPKKKKASHVNFYFGGFSLSLSLFLTKAVKHLFNGYI